MTPSLTPSELRDLVARVFSPGPSDRGLAILIDLPDARQPDHPLWAERRRLAVGWAEALRGEREALGLERVTLAWYPNVGTNNAELPPSCVIDTAGTVPQTAADLAGRRSLPFAGLFDEHSLILAPTELSTTAPLKVAARGGRFRAATMPGFTPAMIDALKLDYQEVGRRVEFLKELCDNAERAVVTTGVDGELHTLVLDLRHRTAHASSGVFPHNGVAGNLPSGEAYIVPYEGERHGDPSLSAGRLPLQLEDEIAILEIRGNRVVDVAGDGPQARREADAFRREPAYANVAELGLGVLGDFGLRASGSILLDEKLGLHIAFGRSDHFGGCVGPADFTHPDAVVHLDRVYIRDTQPRIAVVEVRLEGPRETIVIMRDGRFAALFG